MVTGFCAPPRGFHLRLGLHCSRRRHAKLSRRSRGGADNTILILNFPWSPSTCGSSNSESCLGRTCGEKKSDAIVKGITAKSQGFALRGTAPESLRCARKAIPRALKCNMTVQRPGADGVLLTAFPVRSKKVLLLPKTSDFGTLQTRSFATGNEGVTGTRLKRILEPSEPKALLELAMATKADWLKKTKSRKEGLTSAC